MIQFTYPNLVSFGAKKKRERASVAATPRQFIFLSLALINKLYRGGI